ncbi:MAG: hypothetical protein Q8O19_08330 [Rectinemataceae bacterium]|nr:hypothetical protein [Rectinemataceae bacterium]
MSRGEIQALIERYLAERNQTFESFGTGESAARLREELIDSNNNWREGFNFLAGKLGQLENQLAISEEESMNMHSSSRKQIGKIIYLFSNNCQSLHRVLGTIESLVFSLSKVQA